MEKKIVENLREPSLATVLKEVQSLKKALEVKNLKEQTIACILSVENVKVVEQIATAVHDIWKAANSRPITEGEGTGEGNG
jgi:hypothetical protein